MILEQRPVDFEHRNLFLQLLLGAAAYERKVLRWSEVASTHESLPPDDAVVLALVGVVALGRAARRLAAPEEGQLSGGSATGPLPYLEGLFR